MYLNKAIIYGNLTRDPELRALPNGGQVANFSVATNRVWKDKNGAKQESVEYHNVVIFGRTGEVAAQYLKKGRPVLIEGRIQTRSWDDKEGKKNYRTEIVADNFQFGPSAPGSGGGNFGGGQSSAPAVKHSGPKAAEEEKNAPMDTIEYPSEEINAEDIPF